MINVVFLFRFSNANIYIIILRKEEQQQFPYMFATASYCAPWKVSFPFLLTVKKDHVRWIEDTPLPFNQRVSTICIRGKLKEHAWYVCQTQCRTQTVGQFTTVFECFSCQKLYNDENEALEHECVIVFFF